MRKKTELFYSLAVSMLLAVFAHDAAADSSSEALADPSTHAPFHCISVLGYSWDRDDGLGPIDGLIFQPVLGGGACSPAPIGPPPKDSPVVLLLHGQGFTADEYSGLAWHLAGNGFVVASVASDAFDPPRFCTTGLSPTCIEDRARKGVSFLRSMQDFWLWKQRVDFNNLAVVGHSQGGEAAVEVARILRSEEPSLADGGVDAVVALAPADLGNGFFSQRRQLVGRDAEAFLVLYGSRDEDIKGWDHNKPDPPIILPHNSGFALYDRAGSEKSLEGYPISRDAQVLKSMQFIYGANHSQFSDRCASSCEFVLDCEVQKRLTRGFVNGFLRWQLLGQSGYRAYFTGAFHKPWGVAVYPQFSNGSWGSRRVIDNFQHSDTSTSTLGGAATQPVGSTLMREIVDNSATDFNSMHGPEAGRRLRVVHTDSDPSNRIQWEIPATSRDLRRFPSLSLRIGLGFGAQQPAEIEVRLRSAGVLSQHIATGAYGEIPPPDYYGDEVVFPCGYFPDQTIVHMRTIRIPLNAFGVDLSKVEAVELLFTSESTRGVDIYLDNLELADRNPTTLSTTPVDPCTAGEIGCSCLQRPEQSGGLLGDGRYCSSDVIFDAGRVRCHEESAGVFTCIDNRDYCGARVLNPGVSQDLYGCECLQLDDCFAPYGNPELGCISGIYRGQDFRSPRGICLTLSAGDLELCEAHCQGIDESLHCRNEPPYDCIQEP